MQTSFVGDQVILTGGSTRVPRIQQFLRDLFPGAEFCQGISPEEVIAYGAAVQVNITRRLTVIELLITRTPPKIELIFVFLGAVSCSVEFESCRADKKMNPITGKSMSELVIQ